MKVFYVSLVKDLMYYYLKFEAESELAVRQYLEHEYWREGVWKIPWCSIYSEVDQIVGPVNIIDRTGGGVLYESRT